MGTPETPPDESERETPVLGRHPGYKPESPEKSQATSPPPASQVQQKRTTLSQNRPDQPEAEQEDPDAQTRPTLDDNQIKEALRRARELREANAKSGERPIPDAVAALTETITKAIAEADANATKTKAG